MEKTKQNIYIYIYGVKNLAEIKMQPLLLSPKSTLKVNVTTLEFNY